MAVVNFDLNVMAVSQFVCLPQYLFMRQCLVHTDSV